MAKILIVDDDPDIVESVTIMLENNNHKVIQAYGGIEGLEKAKAEKKPEPKPEPEPVKKVETKSLDYQPI